MEYRIATEDDLISVWDSDINRHPNDENWKRWKKEYILYNKNQEATTFVAVSDNNKIVAQITVVLKPTVKAVIGKPFLCDDSTVNMNGFRCDTEYEGQGHISKLVKRGEEYAKSLGKKYATIGANAKNTRNLQIYFHFGYTTFLKAVDEVDGNSMATVLYYKKEL